MNYKFKFGDEVKDKITGFTGIVTGAASYMTGCNQILVQPPLSGGKWAEALWLDDGRLIKIKKKLSKGNVKSSKGNGACGVAPIK